MNQTGGSQWSTLSHNDPMVSAAGDDFTDLLDLTDFNIDFANYAPNSDGTTEQHHASSNPMDTDPDNAGANVNVNVIAEDGIHHQSWAPTPEAHSDQHQDDGLSLLASELEQGRADVMGFDAQRQLFQQQQQQQQQQQRQQQQQQQQQQRRRIQHRREQSYYGQGFIPPTPTSVEIHGGSARYYNSVDYESQPMRYQRSKDDQMVFTPLVSPAVTPLDTAFTVPEYTVPGAYFSPLTSPALEAQQPGSRRSYVQNGVSSDTSATTSPIDASFDPALVAVPAGPAITSQPTVKRSRRRTSNTVHPPARVVQQSPSMKPQRRKAPSSTTIPAKELTELMERSQGKPRSAPRKKNASLTLPRSQDTSSEAESISPEPLTESSMAPPPVPRLDNRQLTAVSQAGDSSLNESDRLWANGLATGMHPATPASLMKLQKQNGQAAAGGNLSPMMTGQSPTVQSGATQAMEDLALPDAAPTVNHFEGAQVHTSDDQTTPTMSAKRASFPTTSRAQAVSTRITSAGPTPSLEGVAASSASPPSRGPGAVVRGEGKGNGNGRGSKSRVGSTQIQASPALKPRISPSIKPLLPDSSLSAETSALLLASKSNYQNILEGNHLPGVSYPAALSTNLTSKRTLHKLAEQGRRNRINTALQDIAALLPPNWPPSSSSASPGAASSPVLKGEPSGGGAATSAAAATTAGSTPSTPTTPATAQQQASSKANTVEMAIDYIKALQTELEGTKAKLEEAEKKLAEKV